MNLAEILAWKYPSNTEGGVQNGIRTRYNSDADKLEIFDWPSRLGPEPTAAQIAKWTTEFEALPPPEDELVKAVDAATSTAELKTVLKDVIVALREK